MDTCEILGNHCGTNKNSSLLPGIVFVRSKTQAVNIRVLESRVLRTKSGTGEWKENEAGKAA
jgi:hypothetical protein